MNSASRKKASQKRRDRVAAEGDDGDATMETTGIRISLEHKSRAVGVSTDSLACYFVELHLSCVK